jgi:hypothetical protein
MNAEEINVPTAIVGIIKDFTLDEIEMIFEEIETDFKMTGVIDESLINKKAMILKYKKLYDSGNLIFLDNHN